MKRLIVAVAVLMFSMPVFAQRGIDSSQLDHAGWKKLTEAQKADILRQVAGVADKSEQVSASISNPEKVDKWVGVGERIGKLIGGAAKEVGVAVNEFVKTPVGMMAMGMIVWHYMGGALVHIVGGVFLFIIGMSFLLYMLRRATSLTYEYDKEKKDIFGRAVLVSATRGRLSGDEQAGFFISGATILAVSLFTVFTF